MSLSRQKLLDHSRLDQKAQLRAQRKKEGEAAAPRLPTLRREAQKPAPTKKKSGPERLQKILANAGVSSRRKAEELILLGSVSVNGKMVNTLGSSADPAVDVISVDGKVLDLESIKKQYFVLNKPRGYIASTEDPQGRPTVMDLMKRSGGERIYPVGRLDYASEGLLLFTNDGDFAHRMMHPSSQIPRTYMVKIKGAVPDDVITSIREGVHLSDGFVKPMRVRKSDRLHNKEWIEIVLTEGKNLELRRIFALFHMEVDRLRRVAIGTLDIDSVPVGKFRDLSRAEVDALMGREDTRKRK